MTLLVMENDNGMTQFSSPRQALSLLSSLEFYPVASGEHSVDCTPRLSWQ